MVITFPFSKQILVFKHMIDFFPFNSFVFSYHGHSDKKLKTKNHGKLVINSVVTTFSFSKQILVFKRLHRMIQKQGDDHQLLGP